MKTAVETPRFQTNDHSRHRVAVSAVAALFTAVAIVGAVAASPPDEESTQVAATRSQQTAAEVRDSEVPKAVRGPAPAGFTGVSDSEGNLRGFISNAESTRAMDHGEPTLSLGAGRFSVQGFEVVDGQGNITGYLVSGPMGFVAKAVADDPERFASLLHETEEYIAKHEAVKAQLDAQLVEEMKGPG